MEASGKEAQKEQKASKDLMYPARTDDPDKLKEAGSGAGVTGLSPPESPVSRARVSPYLRTVV